MVKFCRLFTGIIAMVLLTIIIFQLYILKENFANTNEQLHLIAIALFISAIFSLCFLKRENRSIDMVIILMLSIVDIIMFLNLGEFGTCEKWIFIGVTTSVGIEIHSLFLERESDEV